MKKAILVLLPIALLLAGCADAVEVGECLPPEPYGFWGGLWHGLITPISFIGSLISDDVAVYAVNNNGGWYDFGFLLGVGGLGFGSSKAGK